MGVSVEVWRARIGGVGPRSCTRGPSYVDQPSLLAMIWGAIRGTDVKMIGVVVVYFLMVLLLLAGYVELNPEMGVSVEVWKVRIGGIGPRPCTMGPSYVDQPSFLAMIWDAIRGTDVKMIGVVVVYFPMVLLLLAGDVELNPGPGRFTCDICRQTFPRDDTLRSHRARHTDQVNCPTCHRPFSTDAVLERHILMDHGSGKRPAPNHDNRPSTPTHHPQPFKEPQPSTSTLNQQPQPSTSKKPPPPASKAPQPSTSMEIDHNPANDNWWRDPFHEEIDTLAIPHISYDVHKIAESHHEKFNATKRTYRVNFENIDVENQHDIAQQLGNVLENVVGNVIGDAAPQDRIQLVVQDNDLDYPIVLPMQNRDDVSVEQLLQAIEQVLQSNQHINLDSGLTIDVSHFVIPAGAVRKKNRGDINEFIRNKNSIIQIKNKDDLCCARAIVTAKAKIDRHAKWNSIRQGKGIQKDLAEQLHRDAGVPLGPCGIDEIKQLQLALPDYQVNVFSKDHLNAIIYSGPPQPKRIFLYHHDNHYDVISSVTGFLCTQYYCDTCKKGYSDKYRHKCNNPCPCCYKLHAREDNFAWKECSDCNRYFLGQTCYDVHKTKSQQGHSTCDKFTKCLVCDRVYRRGSDNHNCGETFCTVCHSYFPPGHKCYMRIVNPNPKKFKKTKKNKKKNKKPSKKPDIRYVFFDLECSQETGVHVPNLCVAHVVCNKCLDKNTNSCKYCGERERVFSGTDTVKNFCKWLLEEPDQPENDNFVDALIDDEEEEDVVLETVVLCHNFKGYDGTFIMQYLYDNSLKPDVIYNGAKLLSIELEEFDLKFIDSLSFLPMPLAQLPSAFGLTELAKGYFPHFHNTIQNTHTVLPHLPDVQLYNPDSMKPKARAKFLEWYEEHKNDPFDTAHELLKYCKSDVDILRRCCLEFRRLFMETTGIDPFRKCITIASSCNLVFRARFLKEGTIGLIPTHGYHPNRNQSAKALKWLKYLSNKDNIRIQHERNGGEVRIEGYPVDGYHEPTKTVYQFEGCYWHGCPVCYTRDTKNTKLGKTMDQLYTTTMEKKGHMEAKGYRYVQMWECQFTKLLQNDNAAKQFVDNLDISSPLVPREAFFGGRTEGFKLYKEVDAGEKIFYVDFTSLYPFVNKYCQYPVGHPTLITENFNHVSSYNGLVKCTVLPPRQLYLRVLPAKINSKLLFALCRTCAENQQQTECDHTDDERSFSGTWVTNELQKAIDKGYTVVKIEEVWHYPRMSQHNNDDLEPGLFTDYINKFLTIKQEASGWPAWCLTEEDKDKYVTDYKEREGVVLNPLNIKKNPGLRALAKLMLNSFWGKFGQRSNLPQTTIIYDTSTYFDYLTSDKIQIQNVNFINSEAVAITWVHKEDFVDMPSRTNVVLAAYTTAHARLKLYDLLDSLGERILYADTDSVVYSTTPGQTVAPLGDYLGELTDELGGDFITHFVTAGPKNYSYVTSKPDSDGNTSHCKVRGITLNHRNSIAINFNTVQNMVKGLGPDKVTVTDAHQIVRDKHLPAIQTKSMSKDYRVVYDKRVIKEGYNTLPYGY